MLQGIKSILILLLCAALTACITEVVPDNVSRIHTGPGPEDLVHDNFEGRNRLLISCNDRAEDGVYGEIESYAIGSPDTASTLLPRVDFPADLPFNPHGIDIVEREGSTYLYVVNHYEDEADISSVIVFRVEENALVFIKEFLEPHIETPNGITVLSNGGFYITNDGASTADALQEFLFNSYNGNVAYCPYEGACSEAGNHLSYPNGILHDGEELYVATSAQKALFRYGVVDEDDLTERIKVCGGIGLDNIRMKDDWLIIAQHIDLAAFLLHAVNPDIQSPFKIIAVNRESGTQSVLFHSSGDIMSGASTGLIVNDDLYIGQVFRPFILKVEGVEL